MNIYVGNIAWSVSDDQLEELFSQYGTVTSAKIIIDKFSKRSRGFGFVEMADGGEQAIAELNDKDFEGRPLVVNESRSKD
ncbi:MAG: RNA recognition motif domain-containing protein [Gammaproteobacteria bacterium]|jgi:RNA recognition motif-containing protein|tara:strand:- start:1229 stop:1468 length:240 start_codon:yes stop_codon:yes gene_type:complete